jgi:hypothetical protein
MQYRTGTSRPLSTALAGSSDARIAYTLRRLFRTVAVISGILLFLYLAIPEFRLLPVGRLGVGKIGWPSVLRFSWAVASPRSVGPKFTAWQTSWADASPQQRGEYAAYFAWRRTLPATVDRRFLGFVYEFYCDVDARGWESNAVSEAVIHRISLPWWFTCTVLGTMPTIIAFEALKGARRRQRSTKGLCPKCGYDLRETPHRCPECGTERSGEVRS